MSKKRYGYCTTDGSDYNLLLQSAKEMRRYPTIAESMLWAHISGRRLGVRFRRQHPVLGYIPDFVCLSCKLVVEVDGGYHTLGSQPQYDAERTQVLTNAGYRVLRFTNEEVLADIDRILDDITKAIEETPPVQ